jgi:hypothetical protein
MVNVVFHLTDFDPTYGFGSEKNFINQWIYNCMTFGVDNIIMIDNTELKIGKYYKHFNGEINFGYYESLIDLKNDHPQNEYNWVFLESKETVTDIVESVVDLEDFEHPSDNVIYVFGPDFTNFDYNDFPLSKWVYFKTVKEKPLYAIPSASIVLYDRLIKSLK